jgi:hypothetical protein
MNGALNAFPFRSKEQSMIHRSSSRAFAAPFADRPKLAMLKLKTKAALSMGLSQSKRVVGTLHLPSFAWPR